MAFFLKEIKMSDAASNKALMKTVKLLWNTELYV